MGNDLLHRTFDGLKAGVHGCHLRVDLWLDLDLLNWFPGFVLGKICQVLWGHFLNRLGLGLALESRMKWPLTW